jgi:hypothetical protein
MVRHFDSGCHGSGATTESADEIKC